MLILSVIQGPDKGRRFEAPDDEPQLIGRSSEALPITDSTVSRRHAELTPDEGGWWLRDLKSQNGTYVNGDRITARVRLKDGDQIRAGSSVFLFGRAPAQEEEEIVTLLDAYQIDSEVEQTIASNADSVLLADPDPSHAAVDHLRVIYRLTTLTTQALDQNDYLRAVLDLIFEVFEPERGFIMLRTTDPAQTLKPAAVRRLTQPVDKEDAKIHVSSTIMQLAIDKGEGVLSSNAMADPRFAAGDSVQRYHIRSAICSPIRFREHTYGAIYIDSSIANYTFTAQQLALMNAVGQHTGLALANLDLYHQKVQAERLAAIGQTVASVSHSIKNILQGLRGGADVVEMGLRNEDLKLARGGWDILKRNLDRIIGLTLNMLMFSRQRHAELQLTKLGPLIEECAQLLEGRAAEREVALIVDVDPEMPPVPIDPGLIHQALMNLMSNGIDAVQAGTGVVTVRAVYHPAESRGEGSPPAAELLVTDNGYGIPRERMPWIFQPFNTTKGARGTGLGLTVTKRIIEEHRGRITVESIEGKGTTFRVVLPADTGQAIDPSATAGTKLSFDEPKPF